MHIRAMAIGVSGSMAIAPLGGTFPLVAKVMTGAGHIGWVAWYAAIGAFLSLPASFLIRKSDLRH